MSEPLENFEEQFKKSSFIIQEHGSGMGHELLLKCSRTAQVHQRQHIIQEKNSL